MKNTDFELNRDAKAIDDALSGQQALRSLVKGLPEDSLSMAWRSALNERLVQEAAVRKRRARIGLFLRPALGLGLACTLAVLVMFHPSKPSVAAPSGDALEAALVTTHRQSTYAWDVAGVGLSPTDLPMDSDTTRKPSSAPATSWNEDDLDSL